MKRQRLTITLHENILKRLDRIIDGQIIKNRSHAIETLLNEQIRNKIIKKAIIFGGGKGVVFQKKIIPKLLFPLDNRTLIEKNIEILKSYGITDIIFSLGSFGKQIRNKIGDGSKYGVKVLYFERDRGNAGILRQAKSLFEDTFLAMNGDILLKTIDLTDMYDFHKSSPALATILLSTVTEPEGLGSVLIKGNLITKFREKPSRSTGKYHLINAGVYLFEPDICELVTPEICSLEYDIFPKLVKTKKIQGYLLNKEWIHLHDEEKYSVYINSLKKQ